MPRLALDSAGLILSSERIRSGLPATAYPHAARRGELVRVRRGFYCDSEEWAGLSSTERYLLKMEAVAIASAKPIVICSYSAAALWGMPIPDDWPAEVHVLGPAASGGRSRNGVVRHPIAHTVERVVDRGALVCTDVTRTALDVALSLPFTEAVACVDWALWRRTENRVAKDSIRRELDLLNPRYRGTHAEAVIGFATHLSDSFGESMARAVMWELGFPAPELQVRFSDDLGDMVADYFWRDRGLVGEFDGKSKYFRPVYGRPQPPEEVVWREKKREDWLRRQVSGVVRMTTADVMNPRRLAAILLDAGLSRR